MNPRLKQFLKSHGWIICLLLASVFVWLCLNHPMLNLVGAWATCIVGGGYALRWVFYLATGK